MSSAPSETSTSPEAFGSSRTMAQIVDGISAALAARGIAHEKNRRAACFAVPIVSKGRFCHVCVLVDRARLMKSIQKEAIAPRTSEVDPRPGAGRLGSNQYSRMGSIAGALETPTYFIRYNPDPWRMHRKGAAAHVDLFEAEHHDAPFDERMDRLAASIRAYCALGEEEVRARTTRNKGFSSGGLIDWDFMYFADDPNGAPQKRSYGGRQKKRKEPETETAPPANPEVPSDTEGTDAAQCIRSLPPPPTDGVKAQFLAHPAGSKLKKWGSVAVYYATEYRGEKDGVVVYQLAEANGIAQEEARDIYDHAVFQIYGGRPGWTETDRARVREYARGLEGGAAE